MKNQYTHIFPFIDVKGKQRYSNYLGSDLIRTYLDNKNINYSFINFNKLFKIVLHLFKKLIFLKFYLNIFYNKFHPSLLKSDLFF